MNSRHGRRSLTPETFKRALRALQEEEAYEVEVLRLRKKKLLHDLVELRLGQLLGEELGPHAHVQREKNGISNGRIDLAVYERKSVMHFEFIASCRNGHVFRDTTSLLGSSADVRLAILIDQDVEPGVAKSFFRAIPLPVVEHVYLRQVLLQEYEADFRQRLKDLVAKSEFHAGGLAPGSFRCSLKEGNHLSSLTRRTLRYENASEGSRLRLSLHTRTDTIELISSPGVLLDGDSGELKFWIPLREEICAGEHKLKAKLDDGRVWGTEVYISQVPPTPSLTVGKEDVKIGESLAFSVCNFPPDTELSLTLWQGHSGIGVFRGTTDSKGSATGEARIPPTIGNADRTRQGIHRLQARTMLAPAEAVTRIRVHSLHPNTVLELTGQKSSAAQNGVSTTLADVRISEGEIECQLSLMGQVPGRNLSLSTLVGNVRSEEHVISSARSYWPDGVPLLPLEPWSDLVRLSLAPTSQGESEKLGIEEVLSLKWRLDVQAILTLEGHPMPISCISRPIPSNAVAHLLGLSRGEV